MNKILNSDELDQKIIDLVGDKNVSLSWIHAGIMYEHIVSEDQFRFSLCYLLATKKLIIDENRHVSINKK